MRRVICGPSICLLTDANISIVNMKAWSNLAELYCHRNLLFIVVCESAIIAQYVFSSPANTSYSCC